MNAPSPPPSDRHAAEAVHLPARKRPAFISEFQPDAIEVEERAPPLLARVTLYLITGLIFTAVTWASLTEIDEIAVAKGKLITTDPNVVVQPLESSVIRRVNVGVGQYVTAGQVLAVLDPTFTEADVQQLKAKFDAADAMVNRLEAELADRIYTPSDPFSPEQAVEAKLAMQRKTYNDNRLRNLAKEIARAEASIAKNRKEESVMLDRLAGVREIESIRTTLLAHETGSKLNLLQARDTRLDVEASIARLRGAQVEAEHDLEKARLQYQEFQEDFRQKTLEALVEARDRRNAASEELKKAELRRRLVTLTAPTDAVVLDVAQRSVGSVIRQAEPLFVLVPLNVPMEAEVVIEPQDIGHIRQSQLTRIKLDAFPFQKHGTVSGKVRTVSQDAFSSETKEADAHPNARLFYKARLTLDNIELHDTPVGFRLLPGMAIQAEIQVGRRRVISYFLYPLLRGLDESIREP